MFIDHTVPAALQGSRAYRVALLLFVLVVGIPIGSNAQVRSGADGIRRSQRHIPGRYLVVLTENADADSTAGALRAVSRGRLRHVYRNAIRGFAIETTEAGARALANDPAVAWVEEDGIIESAGWQSLGFSDSWGLDRLDQRVIDADGGSPYDGLYRYSADGSGVNVYIVDTGIRTTHVDFEGRAAIGFDAIGDGNSGGDCHGHGTHVAGTVGGARSGVAKGVTLISVRALGCDGFGSYSGLALAIDWITAQHVKPAVISMSIQGARSDAVEQAIRAAVAAGITFVAAAGNYSSDACSYLMGGNREAIVVAASGYSDWRESYSNYGPCLDLFAPGGSITSVYNRSDDDFVSMSGTSMATPHVAGAAALYLQRNPMASPSAVAGAIVGSTTANRIQDPETGSPNRLLFTPHFGDVTPPTLSLVEPREGSVLHGWQRLVASAEDDVEIRRIVFLINGVRVGDASIAPYAIDWDSRLLGDGTYALDSVAYDLAGNQTRRRVHVTVRNQHDSTPPQITVAAGMIHVWPGSPRQVPVTFTGTVSDNASVIDEVSFQVHDEYGQVEPSGRITVIKGRFAITVFVEPTRRGYDRDGRRYELTITATDAERNRTSATARATILHDRR